jgi:glycosyltransferase involved in cell wall biosynthesis
MIEKTLFVNGRFLTQPLTGVQRYAFELLREIDALLGEAETWPGLSVICLVPPGEVRNQAWKRIKVRQVGFQQGNLWEQVDLPLFLRGRFLFSPTNIGPWWCANQAVTFHDASTFAMPEAYSQMFQLKYRLIFRRLVHTARMILTDSRFSQTELSHYLGAPVERFFPIPLGGNHLSEILPDLTVLERHGLNKKSYLLTVASQSPHKNFGRILQAARTLKTVEFVAAGGSFSKVFQHSSFDPIPANVHILGYVNDQELKALYENALGFIFPSLYEGFGLPVLEAMQSGCPVLCSSAASVPEVAGEAALYFNPLDAHEMTAKLEQFLLDRSLQDDLRARGFAQAREFTWEKTARQTLNLLAPCF